MAERFRCSSGEPRSRSTPDLAAQALVLAAAAGRTGRIGAHSKRASNTSSIPITSLAAVTGRPDRVIGMHFFNPVPVLKLVEVIRGLETSDETAAAIGRFARDLGKEPVEVRDFPGFVSNRILMPFINEAAYALMEGVAEAEAGPIGTLDRTSRGCDAVGFATTDPDRPGGCGDGPARP